MDKTVVEGGKTHGRMERRERQRKEGPDRRKDEGTTVGQHGGTGRSKADLPTTKKRPLLARRGSPKIYNQHIPARIAFRYRSHRVVVPFSIFPFFSFSFTFSFSFLRFYLSNQASLSPWKTKTTRISIGRFALSLSLSLPLPLIFSLRKSAKTLTRATGFARSLVGRIYVRRLTNTGIRRCELKAGDRFR